MKDSEFQVSFEKTKDWVDGYLDGYGGEIFQLAHRHFHQYQIEQGHPLHIPVLEAGLYIGNKFIVVLNGFGKQVHSKTFFRLP